jgi:hypothetical protein
MPIALGIIPLLMLGLLIDIYRDLRKLRRDVAALRQELVPTNLASGPGRT